MAKIEVTVKKFLEHETMQVRHFFVIDEDHLEFFKDLIVRGAKEKNLEVEFNHKPF